MKVAGFGWSADTALNPIRPGLFDAPAYMAPEQVGGLQMDHRADLYSAAVVAYELLTGALPFKANGEQHSVRGTPLSARAVRPDLPEGLHAVFERVLAESPVARYQSADHFSAALQAAVGSPLWVRPGVPAVQARSDPRLEPCQSPETAPVTPTRPTLQAVASPPRAHRLGRALVTACAAAVLVAVGLIGPGPFPAVPVPDIIASVATAGRTSDLREQCAAPEQPVVVPAPAPPALPPVVIARVAEPPEEQVVGGREPAVVEKMLSSRPAAEGAPLESRRSGASLRSDVRPITTRVAQPRLQARRPANVTRPSQRLRSDLACRQDFAIAREVCKVVRCATAEFGRHPVCVRMHAEQRARSAERDWNY